MKMSNAYVLVFFVTHSFQLLLGQNDPSFTTFIGSAYGVPQKILIEPFDSTMLDYRVMAEVSWKKINHPSDPCFGGMADLWLDENTYGIYLQSTMTIAEKSCYQFSLNSDDGSYLWIDDDLVIDNSGDHKMQYKEQAVLLDSGTYDIRIWYYQLQDLCGFIFNAADLMDETACTPLEKEELIKETFTLSSAVVFESGSHIVKSSSYTEVESILAKAIESKVSRIEIIGHTDNVGSKEDNDKLSLMRAEAIRGIFNSYLKDNAILINAKGMGESDPIESNDTEKGRAVNRRVEIVLIKE